MTKPGPKPKPTRLKLISGNPGGRPLPENEPEPPKRPTGPPKPPRRLDKRAKKVWREIVPDLYKAGILTRIDEPTLELLVETRALYLEAIEMIREKGATVLTPNGYEVQSPWMQIRNKALEQYNRLAAEFGLSPSSRSRVNREK